MKFYITATISSANDTYYFKRIDNTVYYGRSSITSAVESSRIARTNLSLKEELSTFNRKVVFSADITCENEINSENYPELFI